MRLGFILLMLVSSLFADFEYEEKEEHTYKKQHLPLDVRYLHLSTSQLGQARIMIRKFRTAYKQYRKEKELGEKQAATLFLEKSFDAATFTRTLSRPSRHAIEMQATFFSQMHRILTPEQRKRFVRYMEEWEVE